MKTYQKRSGAVVLACCAILLSFLLWSALVRQMVAPVAEVTHGVSLADSAASSAESSSRISASVDHAAAPLRSAPLMPSLDFAGSAASRAADQQKREELLQWEIQESFALSIPSLSIRAPVLLPSRRYWDARDWETLERQMQAGLLYGAVAYPHAVAPGNRGTIVIAGHSSPPSDRAQESRFGSLFAALPAIERGAQILLRTSSATILYEVVETNVVRSGDTTILREQRDESLLKLMTCYPVGSTKDRFVVIAKRLEG